MRFDVSIEEDEDDDEAGDEEELDEEEIELDVAIGGARVGDGGDHGLGDEDGVYVLG